MAMLGASASGILVKDAMAGEDWRERLLDASVSSVCGRLRTSTPRLSRTRRVGQSTRDEVDNAPTAAHRVVGRACRRLLRWAGARALRIGGETAQPATARGRVASTAPTTLPSAHLPPRTTRRTARCPLTPASAAGRGSLLTLFLLAGSGAHAPPVTLCRFHAKPRMGYPRQLRARLRAGFARAQPGMQGCGRPECGVHRCSPHTL